MRRRSRGTNFWWLCRPGTGWRRRTAIPAAALAGERLLLLEDGHCLRDQALAVCGLLAGDRDGQDRFAATSLHTLVQMVAGGLGVTLLPRLAVAAGVTAGTDIELRPLAAAGAWRTLGARVASERAAGVGVSVAGAAADRDLPRRPGFTAGATGRKVRR